MSLLFADDEHRLRAEWRFKHKSVDRLIELANEWDKAEFSSKSEELLSIGFIIEVRSSNY